MTNRKIIVTGQTEADDSIMIEIFEGDKDAGWVIINPDEAHNLAYMLMAAGQGSYEELVNGVRTRK